MRESDFQFSTPFLSYVKFVTNDTFDYDGRQEIEIQTNIQVKNTRLSNNEAYVSILLNIGDSNANTPFALELEYSAKFQWNNDLNNSNIDLFLNQNAPALLLSYARPMVANITSSSRYPAYNLPFINFADAANNIEN